MIGVISWRPRSIFQPQPRSFCWWVFRWSKW